MKRLKQTIVILLTALIMFNVVSMSIYDFGIESVEASEPADADAWTEEDNATYTWKFRSGYKDTMAWTTSDVKHGSYALKVTHTNAASQMFFRVVLDQNYNVTQYDGIFCWLEATSPDTSYRFEIVVNSIDTEWDLTNALTTPISTTLPSVFNATWTRVFIPLIVFDASGTASWNSIRQIYFKFLQLGSADETEVLIDGLHFTTFNVSGQTPTTDQLKMMPMAYYNMKQGQYTETYNAVNYTTMYDWQNLTDNTFKVSTLEAEVLGQTVFALAIAYDYTNFSFYLNEAKRLADWLLQFQEQNGLGRGGFHQYYSNGWSTSMGTVYDGWILAGLSYLYGITSNTTYKMACDLSRNYLTGIMWNDELNVFNANFNNNTQTVNNATGYQAMRDGAGSVGLASYYRFVSQNSTVLDRLNRVLTTVLSRTMYKQQMIYSSSRWEDNAYQMWGMWQAYKATSNMTYRDSFLNVTKICIATYMKHPSLNGSATRHCGEPYIWGRSDLYQDGWGLHCSLPLLFLANEIEPRAYFINATELSLFNHLCLTQDDDGGFQRDDSSYWEKQYYGTPSFVVLASQLYHLEKETGSYLLASSAKTTAISETESNMTLTLDGSGATTTYVYCGNKGKPNKVSINNNEYYEGDNWNYSEATNILTIVWTHSGIVEVTLDWCARIPGDVNEDGVVNLDDVYIVAAAFGTTPGMPRWDLRADVAAPYGFIDLADIYVVIQHFGETY